MLEPGERSILAYFASGRDAEAVREELRNMGYRHVQVDRISKYGAEYNDEYNNPLSGGAETGTGPVLYSSTTGRFAGNSDRVLMGADPAVSGFAAGPPVGEEAFVVTVVSGDEDIDRAEEILKNFGGRF